jgi:hypothetical protein
MKSSYSDDFGNLLLFLGVVVKMRISVVVTGFGFVTGINSGKNQLFELD